jgi:hypothetical protein
MTDTPKMSGIPERPQIADSDAKRTEPTNVRIARMRGWRELSDPHSANGWYGLPPGTDKRYAYSSPYRNVPDYAHDDTFFREIVETNGLCVNRDRSKGGWVAFNALLFDGSDGQWPTGRGPDPRAAVIAWLLAAHDAGVEIKWSVE